MRRLAVIAAVLTALVASGCGQEKENLESFADTEGLYLTINKLTYQIQISRYLNGHDIEDQEYLKGLPAGTAPPGGNEVWFGVWMRVENQTGATLPSATTYEIEDTQHHVYRPIPIDTNINPFALRIGGLVPPGQVVPFPSSAAGQGPIQGSLVLFKIKVDSLQNRPLELHFSNGGGSQTGTYDLDV
jgi:hypothetical protein